MTNKKSNTITELNYITVMKNKYIIMSEAAHFYTWKDCPVYKGDILKKYFNFLITISPVLYVAVLWRSVYNQMLIKIVHFNR